MPWTAAPRVCVWWPNIMVKVTVCSICAAVPIITREGVSMLGISEAAENIGFRTKGYRLTWEELSDEVPLPCIVHWKQRHFVVVYKIHKKRKSPLSALGRTFPLFKRGTSPDEALVYIADPAPGKLLTYTKDEFLNCWLSTKTEGEKEGTLLYFWNLPLIFTGTKTKKRGSLNLCTCWGISARTGNTLSNWDWEC